jgi:NAD(P)H-dependent FMN reductase
MEEMNVFMRNLRVMVEPASRRAALSPPAATVGSRVGLRDEQRNFHARCGSGNALVLDVFSVDARVAVVNWIAVTKRTWHHALSIRISGCMQQRGVRMTTILGISGSLRAQSYNTALLHAAQSLAGSELTLDAVTLHGIPLYDGDVEQRDGLPEAVVALKQRIVASDGVLLVTPEYNNGIPGVFKNAIDWLSRPAADIPRVFGGRPFAVIGASPGGFGTILSQNGWLPVLRTLGTRHWSGGRLLLSRANQAFDENGAIRDEHLRNQLSGFLRGFAQFAQD